MSDPTDTEIREAPGQVSELQAEVALGMDAETFRQSAVGRYLVDRAREAMLDGLERLRNVDPFKPEEVSKAQMDIRVPELMIVWIDQAIEGGKAAASQLQQRESAPIDPV